MKTLHIPVKYQKEDTIFTTKKMKIEKTCDICEGKGTIQFNNKTMKCPECMGKGKLISNKLTNVVCDEPYVISLTKISINSSNNLIVRYKGRCGFVNLNRSESNLFSSKEEAQIACIELNLEKTNIKVEDIIIRDSFKATQPSITKIEKKLAYYKANGKFDSYIIINEENLLIDGYINYLICKMLNIDVVLVVAEDK